ncbi:MAG: WG repeat-containing protein [Chloroflexia bacterium]|nr:WG repeat-containing protein [Chloroflexia bacterium]
MSKLTVFLFVTIFFSCNSLSELYLVKVNNKWGYINRKGKMVIDPIYENCCYQRYEDSCCSRIIWPETLGVVKKNGKYGAINVNGKLKLECNHDFLDQYHNSLLIAKSGNKFGVLSENGDTVFAFIFDNQFISCNSKTGQGQINGRYYLLDFENKTKKETNFDKISYFVEGFAAVKKGENLGFINQNGELIIEAKYQNVWPYNKGLAAAKQNYQWGFIDTTGKFVIEPQFDETEGFDLLSGKYAIVVKK